MSVAWSRVPFGENAVVPMSWDEYEELSSDVRGEYVDGCLVVTPVGTGRHQRILFVFACLLDDASPAEYWALTEWSWKPAADEWHPDVMLCLREDDAIRFTGVPEVIIEVLSSQPGRDLVIKSHRYAAAGLPRYWIVDPQEPSIEAFELRAGAFVPVASATGDTEITLDFGVGTVTLRPSDLLK